MIAGYNRRQVIRGVVALLVSLVALLVTIAFYRGVSGVVMHNLGVGSNDQAWMIGIGLTIITFAIGYLRGRRGLGQYGYEASGVNLQMDVTSGGNFMMQR